MSARKRLKVALCLLLFTLSTVLSGCWDQRPIEDLAIIMGVGVDVNETNPNLRDYTFSHPVFSESKRAFVSVTTSSGPTLALGVEAWQAANHLRYSGGKIRVLLSAEESAKAGMRDLFHYVQLAKIDDNAIMAVTRGRAGDVLRAQLIETERTAMYIAELLQAADRRGHAVRLEVFDVLTADLSPGIDPVLPLLQLSTGKDVVEVIGSALFNDTFMVGDINLPETKLLLALMGRASSIIISLEVGTTEQLQDVPIEIRLARGRTRISPKLQDGQLTVKIDYDATFFLRNYDIIGDLSKTENAEEITKDVESNLTLAFAQLLAKLQAARSDPIGIGKKLRIQDNKNYDDNAFRDLWEHAILDIQVDLRFERDGVLLQTHKKNPK